MPSDDNCERARFEPTRQEAITTAINFLKRAIARLESDDTEHAHVEIGYATAWIPDVN